MAMLKSIRAIVAIASHKGMKIHHMDVVTAFLNSPLTPIDIKEVLLELAPVCELLELGNVVKVFRALYGFKQSPTEWNKTLHDYLIDQGFTQSTADTCVYYKGHELYVAVYVDDGKAKQEVI